MLFIATIQIIYLGKKVSGGFYFLIFFFKSRLYIFRTTLLHNPSRIDFSICELVLILRKGKITENKIK